MMTMTLCSFSPECIRSRPMSLLTESLLCSLFFCHLDWISFCSFCSFYSPLRLSSPLLSSPTAILSLLNHRLNPARMALFHFGHWNYSRLGPPSEVTCRSSQCPERTDRRFRHDSMGRLVIILLPNHDASVHMPAVLFRVASTRYHNPTRILE